MKALTTEEKQELQTLTKSINQQIEKLKGKNLEQFLLSQIPFLKDFKIPVKSADTLSEATQLGDIITSGLNDLFCIVKDEFLKGKEYEEIDNSYPEALEKCKEEFEEEYPLDYMYKTSDLIQKKIQQNKEQKSEYVQALQIQLDKIQEVQDILNKGHKIKKYILRIEYDFMSITLLTFLITRERETSSRKLEKLEKKVQSNCKKLLKKAKKYDSIIRELSRVNEKRL